MLLAPASSQSGQLLRQPPTFRFARNSSQAHAGRRAPGYGASRQSDASAGGLANHRTHSGGQEQPTEGTTTDQCSRSPGSGILTSGTLGRLGLFGGRYGHGL